MFLSQRLQDWYEVPSKSASDANLEYQLQFPFSWLIGEVVEHLMTLGRESLHPENGTDSIECLAKLINASLIFF